MLHRSPSTIVGQNVAFTQVLDEARFLSTTEFNVLLTGESGVGKRSFAQFIHENSRRRRRKMLVRNCAGVTESRLETELFGAGLFDRAHRSTLLLADIGEMGPRVQLRLRRFFETGDGAHGADSSEAKDVRIISASTHDLLQRASQQSFSVDLFYRLNVTHLQIPALRERQEDISFLMGHFLQSLSELFRLPPCELDASAVSALESHGWPGNTRELSEVAEMLALTHAGRRLSAAHVQEAILAQRVPMPAAGARSAPPGVDPVATACYERITRELESFWTVVYGPFLARKLDRDTVRAVVARGLRQTHGNYKELATLFNLPASDYKQFQGFLTQYNCSPRPPAYRVGADAADRLTPARQRRAV